MKDLWGLAGMGGDWLGLVFEIVWYWWGLDGTGWIGIGGDWMGLVGIGWDV